MKKKRSILLVKPQSDESDASEEQLENGNNENGEEEKEDVEMENEQSAEEETNNEPEVVKKEKKRKPGIIYISSIPKYMNVTLLREHLEPFGDLGRVFLQPDKKFQYRKKKANSTKNLAIHFTEGWVEFLSKRRAKFAAENLNNKPISTKKNSRFCDILWSMKYLPRFKWVHLSERLTYEKQMYKQKLQAEISQARKEANFFQANLDKSEHVKKVNKKKAKEERKKNKVTE
ncbi:activator of basal transcription 1-like, partial [Culicoides brevitarsis]|uniref:activator of basal transcription 1-like n=1 Tax=Culicoides brevitarsis TaxID=469753 RepID=UPI00307B99E6